MFSVLLSLQYLRCLHCVFITDYEYYIYIIRIVKNVDAENLKAMSNHGEASNKTETINNQIAHNRVFCKDRHFVLLGRLTSKTNSPKRVFLLICDLGQMLLLEEHADDMILIILDL